MAGMRNYYIRKRGHLSVPGRVVYWRASMGAVDICAQQSIAELAAVWTVLHW
jgi:pyocin large subunit-like protein